MREDEPTVTKRDVKCKKETDKALLCTVDDEDVWVPKSQVHDDSEVYQEGDEGLLVVSEWLARQKGWVTCH